MLSTMPDQIILCPHCKKEIPLNEALSHQLEEKIRSELQHDFNKKREEERDEDRKKAREYINKKVAEEKVLAEKEALAKAEKSVRDRFELEMKDRANEASDLKKRNDDLQNQLLELTKVMRQLKLDNENKDLEMQKKLMEDEGKIREDARKKAEEENYLKNLEKDKKLADAIKMNEELQRKLQQGSQQTQGEVLELAIEENLRSVFPLDEIKPVAKGVRGADITQIVHDRPGRSCGTILWESKQTKNWVEGWIIKLKEDMRNSKANIGVLVSEVLPEDIKDLGFHEGIWVVKRSLIIGLAHALRINLIDLFRSRSSAEGKNEKMEILFNYINSLEFSQRIEALVDSFKSLQDDLEREKRWFTAKWAKQEKNLRTVIDQTYGIGGDLQGIIGSSLPSLKNLELEAEILKDDPTPENSPSAVSPQETLL